MQCRRSRADLSFSSFPKGINPSQELCTTHKSPPKALHLKIIPLGVRTSKYEFEEDTNVQSISSLTAKSVCTTQEEVTKNKRQV
jgi:hypothetical protein